MPATCDALTAWPFCGDVPDGCGGTVACGTCPTGAACFTHEAVPLPAGFSDAQILEVTSSGKVLARAWSGQRHESLIWNPRAGTTRLLPSTLSDGRPWLPVRMNDSEQVLASVIGPPREAWVWDDGDEIQLPPLPGEDSAYPGRISDSGEVLGSSGDRIVVWRHQQPLALPRPERFAQAHAFDINAGGTVVGRAFDGLAPVTTVHAAAWIDGEFRDLGEVIGHEWYDAGAIAVASDGTIVLSTGGAATLIRPDGAQLPLETAPGFASRVLGVNAAGDAVGGWDFGAYPDRRAILWRNGKAMRLELLVKSPQRRVIHWAGHLNDAGQLAIASVPAGGHVPTWYLLTPAPCD